MGQQLLYSITLYGIGNSLLPPQLSNLRGPHGKELGWPVEAVENTQQEKEDFWSTMQGSDGC